MIVAIIRCLGQVTALRLDPLVDLIFLNYMCRGLTPSLFRKQTLCVTARAIHNTLSQVLTNL